MRRRGSSTLAYHKAPYHEIISNRVPVRYPRGERRRKMLRDKLKEEEQERPEELEAKFGACRFCGQTKLLHPLLPWSEENCNEVATELCECIQAVHDIQGYCKGGADDYE